MNATGIKVTATRIANYYSTADETLADAPADATGVLWESGTTACQTMLATQSALLGEVGAPSEGDPGLEGVWLTTTPGRCDEHQAEDLENEGNDDYRPQACDLEG